MSMNRYSLISCLLHTTLLPNKRHPIQPANRSPSLLKAPLDTSAAATPSKHLRNSTQVQQSNSSHTLNTLFTKTSQSTSAQEKSPSPGYASTGRPIKPLLQTPGHCLQLMRLFGSEGHLAVLPKALNDFHLHGAFGFLRRKGAGGFWP